MISSQSSLKQSQSLGDFAEESNIPEVIVNIIPLSLKILQVGINCIRLIESIHQADLTEMQVINKNIRGLNSRTIYRTFKAINENKGIQRRPGSGRNSSISKSTFKVIKKCFQIDNL